MPRPTSTFRPHRRDIGARWFYRLLASIALLAAGASSYAGRDGWAWYCVMTILLLLRSDGVSPERMVRMYKTLRWTR